MIQYWWFQTTNNEWSQKVWLGLQIRSLLLQSVLFSDLAALLGELVGVLQASRHSHCSSPVVISIALVVGELSKCVQWDLSTFIADFELHWCAAALLLTDVDTCQVELSVSVLRKVLEDHTTWSWIRVTRVLSVSIPFEDARVWPFVDQEVANSWVIVWRFCLDSDYFHCLKQSLHLKLELMPCLNVIESFTVDDNSWR